MVLLICFSLFTVRVSWFGMLLFTTCFLSYCLVCGKESGPSRQGERTPDNVTYSPRTEQASCHAEQ